MKLWYFTVLLHSDQSFNPQPLILITLKKNFKEKVAFFFFKLEMLFLSEISALNVKCTCLKKEMQEYFVHNLLLHLRT